MQPPPPFEMPGGPPRKKNSALPWLIVGGVLLCCIGPIAVLGGGGLYLGRQALPVGECQIQFGAISTALGKYVTANGGKLPKADTWQNDIAKYYDQAIPSKEETGPLTIKRSDEPLGCNAGTGTAIAFNTAYSGKVLADIKDPEAVLIYETPGVPSLNKSGPYKDAGNAASPEIFGKHRGWFAVNSSLSSVLVMDGKQTSSGGKTSFRTRAGSN